MKEFSYVITDAQGIHARPAGQLVKLAAAYPCKVTIAKDGRIPGAPNRKMRQSQHSPHL